MLTAKTIQYALWVSQDYFSCKLGFHHYFQMDTYDAKKMHKIRKYDSHRLFKFYLDLDDRRQKVGRWFNEISRYLIKVCSAVLVLSTA